MSTFPVFKTKSFLFYFLNCYLVKRRLKTLATKQQRSSVNIMTHEKCKHLKPTLLSSFSALIKTQSKDKTNIEVYDF